MASQKQPLLLATPDGRKFVAGLTWKRIVVSGSPQASEAAAYEYAAREKSNSLVFTRGARGEVRAVGHAKLPKNAAGALALAQALALRHTPHDRYISAITIGEDQVWVCAIAEGMVVNGFDLVVTTDEAIAKLQEFLAKHPQGSVGHYGDLSPDAEDLSIEEVEEVAISHADTCSFGPVKKNEAAQKKLIVIFAVVGLVVAGQYVYKQYKQYAQRKADALAESMKAPSISAQAAWDAGLAEWLATSSQAKPYALDQVLTLIGTAPAQIVGWNLRTIDCNRSASVWACVGNYAREPELRSTTADFLAAMPAGWAADWGGMDKIGARFSGSAEEGKVVVAELRNAKELSLPLLGFLQNNSRAFQKSEVGAAASVPVVIPKQPDGTAIVIDPSTVHPQVVSMEVAITGPLRSLYKLKGQPISWRVMRFALAESSSEGPGLSRLSVTDARGDIYAIK